MHLAAVPPAVFRKPRFLHADPGKFAIQFLRLINSNPVGAAALDAEAFSDLFPDFLAGRVVCQAAPDSALDILAGSVVDIPDQVGDLTLKGPHLGHAFGPIDEREHIDAGTGLHG